jgi:hypothetical protein
MQISFETHYQWLEVLPTFVIGWGQCDEDCGARHLVITIGWLVWSAQIAFSF